MAKNMKTLKARLRALGEKAEQSDLAAEALARAGALIKQLEDLFADAPGRQLALLGDLVEFQPGETIRIWCDGSCSPNPGPGGWGAIVEQNGNRIEISGGAEDCTNNIMEMTAAIEAIRHTPEQASLSITTDSRYLMDGITRWIKGWKRKGWRKADGKPVLNQPQWKELDSLIETRHVTWEWVRGHSGHPENERCDQLANQARLEQ